MVNQESPTLVYCNKITTLCFLQNTRFFGQSWHHYARLDPTLSSAIRVMRIALQEKKAWTKEFFGTLLLGAQLFLTVTGRFFVSNVNQ